jgi:hypothetical protein
MHEFFCEANNSYAACCAQKLTLLLFREAPFNIRLRHQLHLPSEASLAKCSSLMCPHLQAVLRR